MRYIPKYQNPSRKLPELDSYVTIQSERDNTNIKPIQDKLAIEKSIAKNSNWFQSEDAKPPSINISYTEQILNNVKKGLSSLKTVGEKLILPAAATAAAFTMAAPATVSTLGPATLSQAISTAGRAVVGGTALDTWYRGIGGKTPGEAFDIQNPYGRAVADMISPGLLVGSNFIKQPKLKNPSSILNKSYFTKNEVFDITGDPNVLNIRNRKFAKTVLSPDGKLMKYVHHPSNVKYNDKLLTNQIKEMSPLSYKEFTKIFNDNLATLNKIIKKNNTTGVNYKVGGLTEDGRLSFFTPAQTTKTGEIISGGVSKWDVNINPGNWTGEVKDIPSEWYLRGIPGLEISNAGQPVFGDWISRRGSGTYNSLNEYLKELNLGRVKTGFNAQSSSARNLWENLIKKNKAVGYYASPKTIYGAMKSTIPIIGLEATKNLINNK